MFYDVKVFDGQGNLKKVLGGGELGLGYWRADRKCKGCGRMFNVISKGKAKNKTYDNKPFVPNLVPDGEYCNSRCRVKTANKKNLEEGGMDYGETICDICGDSLEKQTSNQKRHPGRCAKIANARSNKQSEINRLLKLKEKALKTGIEQCL